MTANDSFEKQLEGWLRAEASTPAPAELHGAAIDCARRQRQRAGWLVAVRRGALGDTSSAFGVRRASIAYLLAILTLILVLLTAAMAAGVPHRDPLELGRNGAIAYELRDIASRPYNHGHLIQPDGSGDRAFAQASCPTFSGDGTALAYMTGWDTTAEFAIARADGSAPTVMPDVGESAHALSPDGTQVAWFKTVSLLTFGSPGGGSTTLGAKNELWVTPVSGGPGVRIVDAAPDPMDWFGNPVWSSDGGRIAYAVNRTVVSDGNAGAYRLAIDIIDADGSNPRRLTARPGTDEVAFSWSPDGRFMTYVGLPDGSPSPSLGTGGGPPDSFYPPLDVFVIGADGSGDRNLTNSPDFENTPSWSPDGAHIAWLTYSPSNPAAGFRLITIPMDESSPAGPPNIGPESERVVWSPDGTTLLWLTEQVSDPSEKPQTFLTLMGTIDARFLRPSTTLVTVDHGIGCSPSWQWLEP